MTQTSGNLKLGFLGKKIKGWAININADIRRRKNELLKEADTLGLRYETGLLLPAEKKRMDEIVKELDNILSLEEIKARQRSRDRNIKKGDRNTAYFQAVANQRARKKRITTLDGPNGPLEDTKDMLSHAVEFYKKIWGRGRYGGSFRGSFLG